MTEQQMALALAELDRVIILTHRRPDGDTVGSAAALCLGLRQLGKEAFVLENPQLTEKYRPYLAGLCCAELAPGFSPVAVDVASENMLQKGLPEPCPVRFAIDHHGTNSGYCANTLVRADRAACGEIIYELLLALGVTITVEIAEALYVAVSTDTGCFRYSNVTAHTFSVAAALLQTGLDPYPIHQKLFEIKRFERLRLEAYLTQTVQFYAGGHIGICAIPLQIRQALQLTEDDVDDISGFARRIEGVELAALLRELPEGTVKISVRSGKRYDAGAICAKLGGGGHFGAAGASVCGTPEAAEKALLRAILECYPALAE